MWFIESKSHNIANWILSEERNYYTKFQIYLPSQDLNPGPKAPTARTRQTDALPTELSPHPQKGWFDSQSSTSFRHARGPVVSDFSPTPFRGRDIICDLTQLSVLMYIESKSHNSQLDPIRGEKLHEVSNLLRHDLNPGPKAPGFLSNCASLEPCGNCWWHCNSDYKHNNRYVYVYLYFIISSIKKA